MTIFSDTWNAAFDQSPADTDDASEGALRIRKTRLAARERLAVDHSMAGDTHDGKHSKVTLIAQGGDPTLDTGNGCVYSKVISGITELFFEDSNGVVLQITSNGKISLTSLPSSLADADTLDGQQGAFYQNADNINAGTLNLARIPATLTGKDADTLDGQHGTYYKDVAAGTPMLFYASSAPSGWVLNSGLNDRVIRVVSSGGGVTGGSWTISGLSVLGHALAVAEMPPHSHYFNYHVVNEIPLFRTGGSFDTSYGTQGSRRLMAETGAGVSVNNTTTGNGATHAHDISHSGAWRPAYADFILCNRSA